MKPFLFVASAIAAGALAATGAVVGGKFVFDLITKKTEN